MPPSEWTRRLAVSANRFPNTRSLHMGKHLIMVLLSLLVLTGAAPLLSACNTTAGAGEDMSDAGHAITGSAERNK
jgi:entericidin B